jgi:hypothetical protein
MRKVYPRKSLTPSRFNSLVHGTTVDVTVAMILPQNLLEFRNLLC